MFLANAMKAQTVRGDVYRGAVNKRRDRYTVLVVGA